MKTIESKSKGIERKSDVEADALVSRGQANYIKKSIWKQQVRDFKVSPIVIADNEVKKEEKLQKRKKLKEKQQ